MESPSPEPPPRKKKKNGHNFAEWQRIFKWASPVYEGDTKKVLVKIDCATCLKYFAQHHDKRPTSGANQCMMGFGGTTSLRKEVLAKHQASEKHAKSEAWLHPPEQKAPEAGSLHSLLVSQSALNMKHWVARFKAIWFLTKQRIPSHHFEGVINLLEDIASTLSLNYDTAFKKGNASYLSATFCAEALFAMSEVSIRFAKRVMESIDHKTRAMVKATYLRWLSHHEAVNSVLLSNNELLRFFTAEADREAQAEGISSQVVLLSS